MSRNQLRALAALAALAAVVLIALPVLGVDPSPSPSAEVADPSSAAESDAPSAEPAASEAPAPASAEPEPSSEPAPAGSAEPATGPDENEDGDGDTQKPDKAAKPEKGPKAPEHPVTLTGTVGKESGENGDFTLTVGSHVYKLSAGPKWWWGDANPLAAAVGKTVTIEGEQEEGTSNVDVLAIDGTAIRAAGKPPWAGGWKVVGEKHPGWAQWKVDKLNSRGGGHGRDNAPGQLKKDDAAP